MLAREFGVFLRCSSVRFFNVEMGVYWKYLGRLFGVLSQLSRVEEVRGGVEKEGGREGGREGEMEAGWYSSPSLSITSWHVGCIFGPCKWRASFSRSFLVSL